MQMSQFDFLVIFTKCDCIKSLNGNLKITNVFSHNCEFKAQKNY